MPTPDATGPTLLIAAAACGPMASAEIVLLGKPLGGAAGLPGAVVGYIAATAVVLAVVAVPLAARWNLLRTGRRCGVAAIGAGAGAVVAGAVPAVTALCAGILLLGLLAGPLLVAARTASGVRPFYALTSVAAAAGAAAARIGIEHPGLALVVPGVLAVLAGSIPALRRLPYHRPAPVPVPESDASSGGLLRAGNRIAAGHARELGRWARSAYAATGFGVGATVFGALHLLLFRWNVLDSEQGGYLAVAILPAILVAAVAGYRASALASLLTLLAGGPVLVATAPGAWQLTLGVAFTATVAVRCLATTDSLVRQSVPAPEIIRWQATSAVVLGCAALAGLGSSAALARLWETGSALTLLAVPVLAAALLASRSAPPRPHPHPAAAALRTMTIEGAGR